MIIKVLRYKHATAASHGARSRVARKAGAGLARYVISREKLDLSDLKVSELTSGNHGDNPAAAAAAVVAYVTKDAGQPGRIVSIERSHLDGDDPQWWVKQMAAHAEAAGIDRLYHIIFSHRPDEPVTPEMMRRHRQIIRRVMNLEHSPGLGAMHGDEDHDHFHEFDIAGVGPDGEHPKVGQGWIVEASQIAIAMCEYTSRLQAEPMRRYVADDSGVYHFLSNTRVADADGRILLDRTAMRTLQINHDKMMVAATLHSEQAHDVEWADDVILENIVKPHIAKSTNWEELHKSLARIGVRYVCDGSTASVRFNRSGFDDVGFAPTHFYPRAAPGKLSDRFKETYKPPPPGLWVRPFIAPRYTRRAPEIDGKADRKAAREQAKEVEAYRKRRAQDARAELNASALGAAHNAASRALAEADEREKAAIATVKREAIRKTKATAPSDITPPYDFDTPPSGILWCDAASVEKRQRDKRAIDEAELEERYRIERRFRSVEYWRGQQLAFVAHQHTISVHARDKTARLDALRLAETKFGVVKVFGNRAFQEETIALALEHGIKIDAEQERSYRRRREAIARRQELANTAEALAPLERGVPVNFATLGAEGVAERGARNRRIASFDETALRRMRDANSIEDEGSKGPNPTPTSLKRMMAKLDRTDRDALLLASSRFGRRGLRFLDDEALMTLLGPHSHVALRPEFQDRLSAIARIHMAKREWICAALTSGEAKLVDGELAVTGDHAAWSRSFYRAQKSDPVFKRMIEDAKRGLIDITHVDVSVRPEVASWRQARATSADRAEIDAVAAELYRATTKEQRDALFMVMSDDEGEAYRATKGDIFDAYFGTIYRRKAETESQWRARQRNAQRVFDPRSR